MSILKRFRITTAWNIYSLYVSALIVPLFTASLVAINADEVGIDSALALLAMIVVGLVLGVILAVIFYGIVFLIGRFILMVDGSLAQGAKSPSLVAWGFLVFITSLFPIPFFVFSYLDIAGIREAQLDAAGYLLPWLLTFVFLLGSAGVILRKRWTHLVTD